VVNRWTRAATSARGTTATTAEVTETGRQPAVDRDATVLRLLRTGAMRLEGQLIDASNTTLRAVIESDGTAIRCVYKPVRGERPLWDFPDGTLAGREVAAHLVAQALGWPLVPPTVLRDGPIGSGACQLWIDEPDGSVPLVDFVAADQVPTDWLPVAAARDTDGKPYALAHADDSRLARLAVFDIVVNNADRKGGHVLAGPDNQVYGVDHGLCFHVDDKLRTVLWGWSGRPLPPEAGSALRQLRTAIDETLGGQLASLLTQAEITQLAGRVDGLIEAGCFPSPPATRSAIPWPPM